MNRLSLTARLISAAGAATITLLLLSVVVSIAAPQGGVLMARGQHPENTVASLPTTLAMASNDAAGVRK